MAERWTLECFANGWRWLLFGRKHRAAVRGVLHEVGDLALKLAAERCERSRAERERDAALESAAGARKDAELARAEANYARVTASVSREAQEAGREEREGLRRQLDGLLAGVVAARSKLADVEQALSAPPGTGEGA